MEWGIEGREQDERLYKGSIEHDSFIYLFICHLHEFGHHARACPYACLHGGGRDPKAYASLAI